jgi:hypothetical protein
LEVGENTTEDSCVQTKTRIKLGVCAIKAAYDMEKRTVGKETRKKKGKMDRE